MNEFFSDHYSEEQPENENLPATPEEGTPRKVITLHTSGFERRPPKISPQPSPTAVLLLSTPDRPGVIAVVTDFITRHGGNIIYVNQHVDTAEFILFMRIEFETRYFDLPYGIVSNVFMEEVTGHKLYFIFRFNSYPSRMAIYVSKTSHCLYDLLAHYAAMEWNVRIPLIISNHPDLEDVAQRFRIPFHYIPTEGRLHEEVEQEHFELLKNQKINLIVLARYMQILSPSFVDSYRNKIINIHHSFLPAFAGPRPYHAAYERGVKLIGATSHYVTSELDAGPIIEQDTARVTHRDTLKDLIRKGQELEKVVLSRAVEKRLQHKILLFKNKTIVFD
jgi:formyltetrahydrofolate deformylase